MMSKFHHRYLLFFFITAISCERNDFDPKVEVTDIFAPRGSNCLLKRVTDQSGAVIQEYIYDDQGKILSKYKQNTELDYNDFFNYAFNNIDFYYNDDNKIDSLVYFSGETSQGYALVKWENGLPVKLNTYLADTLFKSFDYKFNSEKILIETTETFPLPHSLPRIWKFKYSDKVNLIEINGQVSSWVHATKYDDKRNYTRLTGWQLLISPDLNNSFAFSKNNVVQYVLNYSEPINHSLEYTYNEKGYPLSIKTTAEKDGKKEYEVKLYYEYENCE